jgi:hypothetical protein
MNKYGIMQCLEGYHSMHSQATQTLHVNVQSQQEPRMGDPTPLTRKNNSYLLTIAVLKTNVYESFHLNHAILVSSNSLHHI